MTTLTPPKTSFAALMRLAGPIFVANIAIVGSGTIDTIMAGQLGKNHLAAIAVSIAATISVVMGLAGILQSLSPIAGHHYGARNYRAVGEELEQNFWLGGFLCLFGVPLLMYTELWISLGKVEGEVARMAAEFLFFTALALPACLFARTFISVNAALSRPRITMWVSLAMLALKVPLNGIFMYGWLGFPAMGGSGAGVSFCILNYLAFLCYLAIWKRDAFYRTMHAERIFGPRWALMKEQLHVGIPIGLSTFFEVSSFTLMAIFVARFGSEAVSAHQIVANITSLCYMLPLSIGIASSVLISQCLGARWPAVAYTVLTRTLKVSVASATCIVTILFFARHWLALLVRHGRVRDGGLAPHLRLPLPRLRRHAVRELVRPSRLPRHAPADDHLRRHALGRGPRRRLHARLRQPDHGRADGRLRLLERHGRRPLAHGHLARLHGHLGGPAVRPRRQPHARGDRGGRQGLQSLTTDFGYTALTKAREAAPAPFFLPAGLAL